MRRSLALPLPIRAAVSGSNPDAMPGAILTLMVAVLLAACLAALVTATGAGAQQLEVETLPVETVGASDVALDRRLTKLLEADPVILTRDTHVLEGDTIRGSILVLDATLILEGVVLGDLVVVDAGAFVRPSAVVRGDLVNMGGGLYRSELARIGGTIIDLPTASYRVVREPDRIVIVASDTPSPLKLDGFMGFRPPTYDRVNGLTTVWGARYRLPRLGDLTPTIRGRVGWQTQRGDPTYALSGDVRYHATAVEVGYEDGWATNERWIRGDVRNSLNYVWNGKDSRDYYQRERIWAGARRELGDVEKSFYGVLGIRGQREDAESLRAGEPWHLFSGDVRPNLPIDDGRTTSLVASFDVEWHGRETDFVGGVEYEAAREWLDGVFTFDRVAVRGDWAMHALADHTLEIEFFVQQPLGSAELPRQRWSFVGGSGSLQTMAFAQHRGDHVVAVESEYIIPLPERAALPFVGAPVIRLIHAAGMAWTDGEDPAFRQEVGARLDLFALYFRYMLDPADPENSDLDIGLTWPFDSPYPWERR